MTYESQGQELKQLFDNVKIICSCFTCTNCPLYDEDDERCGFHIKPLLWDTDRLSKAIDNTISGGIENERNN